VITSGPVIEAGMVGVCGQSFSPVGTQPFSSLGLEGLDAELELLRSSEGLTGARTSLVGLRGEQIPASSGFHTFLPHIPAAQEVEGFNPFAGVVDRLPPSGGGLESFSVGQTIGSEALRGTGGGLGDVGLGLPRVALSSGGQGVAVEGRDGFLHEAEPLLAPRKGGSGNAPSVKKKPKAVSTRPRKGKLVLGLDVEMAEAEDFSKVAVVGHARGRRFSIGFLRRWVAGQWMSLVPCAPEIRVLTKGWFSFIFHSSAEVDAVLRRHWEMAGVPIILKRWTPFFDSKLEKVVMEPIWVRLPGFPMELWKEARFAEVGNYLGEYICADYSFKESGIYTVAKIMVKIDLRLGLTTEITIQGKDGEFTQILDYEGVPFRCHRCHVYGHLVDSCPYPFRASRSLFEENAVGEPVLTPGGGIPAQGGGVCGVNDHDAAVVSEIPCGGEIAGIVRPVEETAVVDRGKSILDAGVVAAVNSVAGPSASWAVPGGNPRPGHLRRGSSLDSPGMSHNIVTLTPPVHISGLGGVGSLCSSPLVSSVGLSPVAPCRIPIVDACFSSSIVSTNASISSEGRSVRYALRSREVAFDGPGGKGLDVNVKIPEVKGRGRKSLLSKAQARAKVDILMGTQTSIDWALRAGKAQEGLT